MKFARRTQIIYPKDLAMIVHQVRDPPRSRVFEAGTGSGAATATFASLVAPSGQVYSYDVNPEFQNIARKNLEKFGLMGVDNAEEQGRKGRDRREGPRRGPHRHGRSVGARGQGERGARPLGDDGGHLSHDEPGRRG